MQWLVYMNAIMPEGLTLDENEEIIVIAPDVFERLGPVLKSTTNRTLANYLMWRIVLATSDFLNEDVRRKKTGFFRVVSGQQEAVSRWKECITYTSSA